MIENAHLRKDELWAVSLHGCRRAVDKLLLEESHQDSKILVEQGLEKTPMQYGQHLLPPMRTPKFSFALTPIILSPMSVFQHWAQESANQSTVLVKNQHLIQQCKYLSIFISISNNHGQEIVSKSVIYYFVSFNKHHIDVLTVSNDDIKYH